ncbi:MAG: hypothetical protein IK954_04305 [Clostridia bacterium]|nr:hypothetical protein [Clostridia bacterium]
MEEKIQAGIPTAEDTGTPPAAEVNTPTDADNRPAEAESGVYLPVYNGEVVRVQADDTQRVTGLLQKGLRFEQFSPQFERLKTIGRALGCSRPEQAVEKMAEALEEVQYEELLKEVGGNEAAARELLAARHAPITEAAEADGQALMNERLTEEFLALKAAYPEVGDVDSLPESLWRQAAESGRSLTECWLAHAYAQQRRVGQAQQAAAAASAVAVGSLRSIPEDGVTATSRSFLQGFRSRI